MIASEVREMLSFIDGNPTAYHTTAAVRAVSYTHLDVYKRQLREDTKPQLYPIDLCELLQQVAAQADMIRAQLGVDIRLDYGGCTTCCCLLYTSRCV